MRKYPGPKRYLAHRVTRQSVKILDRYVNLAELALGEGLDHSYVSRILSGERVNPSLDYLTRIAKGLGMSLDVLLYAIEQRRDELKDRRQTA